MSNLSILHVTVVFMILLNGAMLSLATIKEPEANLGGGFACCGCSNTPKEETKFSNPVVLYKMLTPSSIQQSASFIHQSYILSTLQLTFNPVSKMAQSTKVLKIPLIQSSDITPEDKLVVKVAIGLDTSIGLSQDSDMMFMLSDGVFAHGFIIHDKSNYQIFSPCFGLEGKSGSTLLNEKRSPPSPVVVEKNFYSGRIEMTIRVADRWGSCYTSHDAGFTREMSFTNKLDPTKGLFFELYKNEGDEKVGLKFLEFTVLREN